MVEITASYPAGKVGTTAENLKAAAEGENEEWTELYPTFAAIAKEEDSQKWQLHLKWSPRWRPSTRSAI